MMPFFTKAGRLAALIGPALGAFAMAAQAEPALVCRNPEGRTWIAKPGEAPGAECATVTLPVPREEVAWLQWLPGAALSGSPTLILSGAGRGDAFAPGSAHFAAPPARPARPPALAMGPDLLPGLELRTFGAEERATVTRREGAIVLACRAGTRPAGLILGAREARLPGGARFGLRLEAEGQGFSAGLTGRNGTPSTLLPIAAGRSVLRLAVDDAAAAAPWFVVVCPQSAGEFVLRTLALEPEPVAGPTTRSAWAWRPALWRDEPDRLLAEARRHGFTRLYVSVDINGSALRDTERFAGFVTRARAEGIGITVVEGDPAMALDEGRRLAIERLRAILAYQDGAPPTGRIEGVQYDIEPYIMTGYAARPEPVLAGWAQTIEALRMQAGSLALDMVLPFWLPDDAGARQVVMPALARAATSVTAMAYRTSGPAVQAAAEPLLAWGVEAGLPVQVALEAGPLDDEVSRTYRPASTGTVLAVPAGNGTVVVQVKSPRAAPGGIAFALEREDVASASAISFLGDLPRLDGVSEELLTILKAWSSFKGLAFHGVVH
ncbi:MAG TPA: hypothetical protein VIL09_09595 [Microvirga sp.]|jgi:hypothetical protein